MFQVKKIGNLTAESTEDEIAAAIAFVKQSPKHSKQLLKYLRQQHPLYQGRSSNEIIRIRGYLFESFMHTGLPESALPFVLEVLETSRDAYLVAGAAIALRGLSAPRPQLISYLLKAVINIKLLDDAISFETYKPRWPLASHTTALLEIFKTFQWLGGCAIHSVSNLKELCLDEYISDTVKSGIQKAITIIEESEQENDDGCCNQPVLRNIPFKGFQRRKKLKVSVAELLLEDQNGHAIKYKEYFRGTSSVLVFFYTRCDNQNKCSLTITKLGQLQKALVAEGLEGTIKTAAITYDPVYDQPYRIKSYCENRGMLLNEKNSVFRIEAGLPVMLEYVDSGVNYIGSIINHHTTELFILDKDGNITEHFQQLQWTVSEVVAQLKLRLEEKKFGERTLPDIAKNKMYNLVSPVFSLLIVFFPKCPFCWAAYLSVLGITNIHILQLTYGLFPFFILLLFINLFSLYKGAHRRNGLLPFYISLTGIICIIFFGLLMKIKILAYLGIGLILTGSLLNSLTYYTFMWMRQGITRLRADFNFLQ